MMLMLAALMMLMRQERMPLAADTMPMMRCHYAFAIDYTPLMPLILRYATKMLIAATCHAAGDGCYGFFFIAAELLVITPPLHYY